MPRARSARPPRPCRRRVRRLCARAPGAFVLGLAATLIATPTAFAVDSVLDDRGVRVAVARFVGDGPELAISEGLSDRLAMRSIERLIPPEAFAVPARFDPRAAEVRQWAYNAAVDHVVVGRVAASDPDGEPSALELVAVVRSGHSGGELTRHRVTAEDAGALSGALDRLGDAILASLGVADAPADEASAVLRDPRSPEPALERAAVGADASEAADDDRPFAFEPLDERAPIEINADEAEIVERGTARRLVFQRNVRVRQGGIRLASDRLEAVYRKGESEPERLVAQGGVRVAQGRRQARCDRATYLRSEQRLSCEGHAELVQGCDVVRGNTIEFDLQADHARVMGAASIVIRPGDPSGSGCVSLEGTL